MSIPHISADQVAVITLGLAVLTGMGAWFRKRVIPVWRKLRFFLEDWNGIPARPGVPARVGVMARIDDIESIAKEARYHSMPNGGNSAYDKLTKKIDDNRDETRADVGQVQSDVSALIGTLAQLTRRVDENDNDNAEIHREISIIRIGKTENHHD